MDHDSAWFATREAVAIGDNILLHQCRCGGWPKNIDMARTPTAMEKQRLSIPPADTMATIDNGATYTQLFFLARIIDTSPEQRFIQAFIHGLEYLLAAQYENGGWPQFFPLHEGYYSHITFNDDAMVGVLFLLRDIAVNPYRYAFVDASRRSRAERAVEKGIDCILATQLKEDDRLTVWCAQYDERSLQPAPARTYERVSLSGEESVGIVRFLMSIDHPSTTIVTAIEKAVEWFGKVKIKGIRIDQVADASSPTGFNRVVVADPTAPAMWARFYQIGSNRPFFSDRSGKIYDDLAQISSERRNKYAWLGYWPQDLLENEYPTWLRIRQMDGK